MYPEFPILGFKQKCEQIKILFPAEHQNNIPGIENIMHPLPIFDNPNYKGTGKLFGKVAIITGGDSGIGRAVAIAFAKEGADIVIVYLNEIEDAMYTKECVESYGVKCLLIETDLTKEKSCEQVVNSSLNAFGKIDILVNNAGFQMPQKSILDITENQLKTTFETNVFSVFYLTKAVLPHLKENSSIINTSSVNSFRGNKELIDYSATKGAVTAFTKSLSSSLVDMKIRVNEVAPGPIWTPFIPSTFSAQEVEIFGSDVPLKRAGQPFEVAPAYVYLASDDSRYVTGQTINVNGGTII